MQCLEVSKLMSLCLDSAATPVEEQALQEHLAACAECRTQWRLMQRTHDLFEGAQMAAPPPLFTARVMARVQKRQKWLAVLRGGIVFFLGFLILGTLCIAPLVAGSTAGPVESSVWSAMLGAMLRVLGIVGTLLRAALFVLRAMLGSPNWLILAVYGVVLGGLAFTWVKLVTRPMASGVDTVS